MFTRLQDFFTGLVGLRSAAQADFNQDGTLDLFMRSVCGGCGKGFLLAGNPSANHWMRVRLHGLASNRDGIGAKVKLFNAGARQFREIRSTAGAGYDAHENVAHFGLGTSAQVEYLRIQWPSGTDQWIAGLPSDTLLTIMEGASGPPTLDSPSSLTAEFTDEGLVRLDWVDVADNELGYLVERSLDGNTFEAFATREPNSTTTYDSSFQGATIGRTVRYRLRAVWLDDVTSGPSNVATVNIVVTGLDEESSLQIYPVPASDRLTVRSRYLLEEIQLVNTRGIEVHALQRVQDYTVTLSTGHLPVGVYFLIVRTSEGVTRRKVAILR
jgi:hypothetical protein